MKKLLTILFLCSRAFAQTTPFTNTPIPFTDPDLNRPFGGANEWYRKNDVNMPASSFQVQRNDYYWRFESNDVMPYNNSQGVYSFTRLDQELQWAIDHNQKFAFGIMNTCCSGGSVSGSNLYYPLWLHNAMQSSGGADFTASGAWIPNYDNTTWIAARKAMHQAVNNHIMTGSYKGVNYRDIILYIDCLEYGDYGEWATLHGSNATAAHLDSLINGVVFSYPNFQIQGQPAMFDAGVSGFIPTPASVGYYALTVANNVGKMGYSNLCWGCTDWYRDRWTNGNTAVYNSLSFGQEIRDMYKTRPITGEPPGFSPSNDANMDSLPIQVGTYHVASFANSNYPNLNSTTQTNARAAAKMAGYRLELRSGTTTTTPSAGGTLSVVTHWRNTGITPTYEHWNIAYTLSAPAAKDTVNLVVIQGESNASGQASNSDVSVSAELTARASTQIWNNSANTFQTMTIGTNNDINECNPAGKHGMELGLANGAAAGLMGTTVYVVKVGAGGTLIDEWLNGGTVNTAIHSTSCVGWPVVTSRVDAAVAYLNSHSIPYKITVWQSIGINDYNAGTTNTTFSTKMAQFRSDFRARYGASIPFLMTLFFSSHPYDAVIQALADNDPQHTSAAIFTDDAKRTTDGAEASTINGAHWTYSGFKTFVPRFVSKMTSGSGGSSAKTWTGISSFDPYLFLPAGSDNTVTDNFTLSGIPAGSGYTLKVALQDPKGYRFPMPLFITTAQNADGSYTLRNNITVAGGSPVAAAGLDQSVTVPTSSVTLDGTGSSGTITSYTWTKVSGPNTPTFSAATSATTTVSGLVVGTYIFQLAVTGGSTDQVQVVVNPALPPSNTIFTTQVPKSTTDNDNQATVGQELGLRFKSTVNGFITGIRFYKTSGNVGTHIGELYSNTGTRLAQATFTNETTTGWQVVSLSTPVAITANTQYVVAYFSSLGNYVEDNDYFLNNSVTNAQFIAIADATGGATGSDVTYTGQGPFKYSATPVFPDQLYRSANYWVDVVFAALPAGQVTFPKVSRIIFNTAP